MLGHFTNQPIHHQAVIFSHTYNLFGLTEICIASTALFSLTTLASGRCIRTLHTRAKAEVEYFGFLLYDCLDLQLPSSSTAAYASVCNRQNKCSERSRSQHLTPPLKLNTSVACKANKQRSLRGGPDLLRTIAFINDGDPDEDISLRQTSPDLEQLPCLPYGAVTSTSSERRPESDSGASILFAAIT